MTTIRVTPIGGEPVELADETACIAHRADDGERLHYVTASAELAKIITTTGGYDTRAVWRLAQFCERPASAFVHIGDTWPLCTVESWRQRAERLERELAAQRAEHERYKAASFAERHGLLFIPAGSE